MLLSALLYFFQFLLFHAAVFLIVIVVPQVELTAERITALLQQLDRNKLAAMAETAKNMAKPQAAERVAEIIISVAK